MIGRIRRMAPILRNWHP